MYLLEEQVKEKWEKAKAAYPIQTLHKAEETSKPPPKRTIVRNRRSKK